MLNTGRFCAKTRGFALREGNVSAAGAEGAEKRDEKTRRGAKSVIFAPQKLIGCEVSEMRTWSVRKEILPRPGLEWGAG